MPAAAAFESAESTEDTHPRAPSTTVEHVALTCSEAMHAEHVACTDGRSASRRLHRRRVVRTRFAGADHCVVHPWQLQVIGKAPAPAPPPPPPRGLWTCNTVATPGWRCLEARAEPT